ncbi:MAG: hypothetical protein GX751_02160 [Desulfuromonadaceae bacterium]|nr:hypothetical protein [Desulfuromonadaceae bacterium]
MKETLAKSLLWSAVFVLVLGMLIGSPSGQFFCFVVAAAIAALPLSLAGKRRRLFAAGVTIAAVLLAWSVYSDFRQDFSTYRERAKASFAAPAR